METSWTLIGRAAAGGTGERERFVRLYEPVVRAYLQARWRGIARRHEIDDVAQEVFLECLKEGGALERAEARRPGGFRAFLHGVTRNVAARFQERRAKLREVGWSDPAALAAAPAEDLEKVFDRAWARAIVQQAAERQPRRELLRLRFEEGRPVREIARLWGVAPDVVHKQYEGARRAFERALREVVAFHHPGTAEEVTAECRRLLALLA